MSQQDRGLGGHHREVLDANLDQRAARAQPPERKRRLGPRADRDHRRRRAAPRVNRSSSVAHDLGRSQMGVVEDEHHAAPRIGAVEDRLARLLRGRRSCERGRRQPHELALDRARPTPSSRLDLPYPGGATITASDRVRRLREAADERGAPDQSVAGPPGAPSGYCERPWSAEVFVGDWRRRTGGAAAGGIGRAWPSSGAAAPGRTSPSGGPGARRPTPVFEEARTTVGIHVRRPVARPARVPRITRIGR